MTYVSTKDQIEYLRNDANGNHRANLKKTIEFNKEALRNMHQINAPSEYYALNKVNRFKLRYPDHEIERSVGYVIFTKPDLNIVNSSGEMVPDETSKIPASLHDLVYSKDIEIVRCLKQDYKVNFIGPILDKAENFEVSDVQMKTRQTAESSGNWKIDYGFRTNESKGSGTFSINYTDDRNLTIYKLHKIWVEYMHHVFYGTMQPSASHIMNGILDYASSVYYILVGEDGETIRYYAKYTGVFPTTIPDGTFSWAEGDESKRRTCSITYQYSFFEAMNPLIIKDFNYVFDKVVGPKQFIDVYDKENGIMGPSWGSGFLIETHKNPTDGELKYKLKFTK